MRSTLLDHFSALEDPRQAWKVVYPLSEILLIVLCATMAGAEDFADSSAGPSRSSCFSGAFSHLRGAFLRTTRSTT